MPTKFQGFYLLFRFAIKDCYLENNFVNFLKIIFSNLIIILIFDITIFLNNNMKLSQKKKLKAKIQAKDDRIKMAKMV